MSYKALPVKVLPLDAHAIINLANGLQGLDKGGPWRFARQTRMRLGVNLARVKALGLVFERARTALVQGAGAAPTKADDKAAFDLKLSTAVSALADKTTDVELFPVSELELMLDRNHIPIDVIAGIMPVIVPDTGA